ncbi:MAG: hypothetical protein KZY61_03525 [Clostridiaceae bacterium]|nr:hypothetical protein [Clostridiaceae bacterium]MBW4860687.1 hypothetical protein [Clostridiaceae bacterium]MBW4867731.1 hypothetical protein [Clostridiaceae bacterium]
MRFPNYYLKLFKEIHVNLYKKFDDNQIHCFLCGSNDDEHIKKLMVLMDETYKEDESFINYGPIKKLKDHKELKDIKRVFYYKLEKEKKLNTY